jgi:hypothetical protein
MRLRRFGLQLLALALAAALAPAAAAATPPASPRVVHATMV